MVNELILRRGLMGTRGSSVDWENVALELITGEESYSTDLVIPEGVTSIRPYAFRQCYFNSITFPSTLTTIGQQAFEYLHGLSVIELGENVSSIGNWAFQSLYDISSFIIHATTPPTLGSNALNGSYPIYVPDESVEAYKTASRWSNLASRIFPISDLTT